MPNARDNAAASRDREFSTSRAGLLNLIARRGAAGRAVRNFLRLCGWSFLVAVALVCILPIVIITIGGFSEGNLFSDFHASLGPWARALTSSQTLHSISYSFILSLRVPVALSIAFFIAWYLARYDVFGKRVILYALWLAFFLPILPATLGWILLLDPNYGIINVYLSRLFGVRGPVFNIYSLGGITWVHLTLSTIPIMVILIEPAQRFIDSAYEEASTMSGAGFLATLRRVTLPLIAPTLLVAFIAGLIRSLEAFEVEQLLGVPSGIFVYSTRVFNLLRFTPPDEPQAMALSTFFLGILFVLVACYRLLLRWVQMAATVTGKGARLLPRQRTRFSDVISVLLFLMIAATVLLPFAMVVLSSFSRLFGFFNLAHPLTTEHWSAVLESP